MTNGRGGPALPLSADPKALLRAEAKRTRQGLSLARPDAGAAIAEHFFRTKLWSPVLTLAGYAPMNDEADVMPLLDELGQRGARMALPAVTGRDVPLRFRSWRPGDPLEPGPHRSRHPPDGAPELIPDLVLVPLLAFDSSGIRLGYGGGYYDRTLAALRRAGSVLAVGIAFRGQEVAGLPHDPHDQRLDWIVTEAGAWEFAE